LRRSRPHNRSQYLRIQAHHLAQVGQFADAITLLDRLIADYPDRLQLAPAHQQRGTCLMGLGFADSALDAYRDAIDAQRAFPNMRTTAPLDFGFAVARLEREDLYDEALSVVNAYATEPGSMVFPYEEFLASTTLALIAHARSQSNARSMAQRALKAAAATHSGFPRHPSFGLVGSIDSEILDRLHRVAG
jgi:tetratricopeptide (TPR) repeat protein